MTINTTQPLPSSFSQPTSIPFFFKPTLSVACVTTTETIVGITLTSGCEANATARITDDTTGASQYANLNISTTGDKSDKFELSTNANAGDTLTIDLLTVLDLRGREWFCPDQCGAEGATGIATVDPSFEFDQAAFDAEMGAHSYDLADYYSFSFSPNIPTTPEPSSLVLFGSSLAGACVAAWRRRRVA